MLFLTIFPTTVCAEELPPAAEEILNDSSVSVQQVSGWNLSDLWDWL